MHCQRGAPRWTAPLWTPLSNEAASGDAASNRHPLRGRTRNPSPSLVRWHPSHMARPPRRRAITAGPAEGSELTSTSATFTFTSSAKGKTKFYCSLDGVPATSCSSGVTYNNLSTGAHSFSVYSVDRNGTADPTPATRTWTASRPVTSTRCPRRCRPDARPTRRARSSRGSPRCRTTRRCGSAPTPATASRERSSFKNRNLTLRRQRLDVQVAQRPVRPARDVAGMGLDRQLPQHDDRRLLRQRRRASTTAFSTRTRSTCAAPTPSSRTSR